MFNAGGGAMRETTSEFTTKELFMGVTGRGAAAEGALPADTAARALLSLSPLGKSSSRGMVRLAWLKRLLLRSGRIMGSFIGNSASRGRMSLTEGFSLNPARLAPIWMFATGATGFLLVPIVLDIAGRFRLGTFRTFPPTDFTFDTPTTSTTSKVVLGADLLPSLGMVGWKEKRISLPYWIWGK